MKSNKTITIIIGLLLIFFAFFVLISLLAKLNATSQIITYWPAFLILVGVLTINPKSTSTNGISMAIIFLGIFGLMHRLGVFQTANGQALLAVMLGLVGLTLLAFAASKPKNKE